MALFDNNKKNKHINALNKREIENEIAEKTQEIGQLKKEISTANAKTVKINQQHEEKLKKLAVKQETFKKETKAEKDSLTEDLKKLEEKKTKYQKDHEDRQKEILSKINELKEKKKSLLDQKLEADKQSFEKQKNNLDKELQALKASQQKQEEEYDAQLAAMKKNYEKIINKKKEEINDIKAAKQKLQDEAQASIDDLKNRSEEITKKHQETLKQLSDEHRVMMDELKDKEAKLKESRNELSELYTEADSLTKLRNNLIKELESAKIRTEHEYNAVTSKYEAENIRLIKDNDFLTNELITKQKKVEEQVKAEKEEYAKKLAELEYLYNLLSDKMNANTVDLQKKIDDKDTELKAKYNEYFLDLDDKYKAEKSKLEEELKSLKYAYAQEEEQFRNRNEFLKERYKNRDAQYKKNVEDIALQVNAAESDLTVAENEYNTKIDDFEKDIEKLKRDYALAAEEKAKSYENQLDDVKKQYTQKRKEINEMISQTKTDIEKLGIESEKLQSDLNDYLATYKKKKETLDKEHEANLSKQASKKADIENSIAPLNVLIKENEEKHIQNISEIEAKKNEINAKHEEKMTSLNDDFARKINVLNTEHADAMAEAQREYNAKIEKLATKHSKDISDANERFASKQKEYDDEKVKLENDIVNIHNETEEKIGKLNNQKAVISETIAKIREDLLAKQNEHDAQVKQLESEHIAKLDQMARAQEQALAQITVDYEQIPSRELAAVRADYEAKQKEYNDKAAEIAIKKQGINAEYQNVENQKLIEKQKAEDDFALVNRQFERIKADAEKQEADLNKELAKRKQELEDYKDELEQQIQVAKDEKAAEIEKVSKQFEDEYAAVEKQYADKQAVIAKQYDEEIKAHQADLDSRYENLNSLINEINQRRENIQREYTAKYNAAVDSTKLAQEELDALVNQNNLRRSELAASIKQKKADNDAKIANIRANYETALNEKKQAYEKYISEVREKCNNLRKDISDLEKEKEIEVSKLETFANEKLTAMANLENESALFIENIRNKMSSIAAQQVALENAHSKRVTDIKSQIASIMSGYDNLLRTRTKFIADATNDGADELTIKAKAFKERLNALEESHKQILIDLDDKRNETLNKIAGEIEQLDASKPDKLKAYENEITDISIAYDKLLRDEQAKQERINDLISRAKQDEKKMLEEIDSTHSSLENALLETKKEIFEQSEQESKKAGREFNEITANLKEEFEKLVSEKSSLSKNIVSLADKFSRIDKEVFDSTQELKDKYMGELLKIRQEFDENRRKKQRELSALDTMSGSKVDDVFKNFS